MSSKTKIEIQRRWELDWFIPLKESLSLTADQAAFTKEALLKEVGWIVTIPESINYFEQIAIRLQKINTLDVIYDGDLSGFDDYQNYRKLFFEWCLT